MQRISSNSECREIVTEVASKLISFCSKYCNHNSVLCRVYFCSVTSLLRLTKLASHFSVLCKTSWIFFKVSSASVQPLEVKLSKLHWTMRRLPNRSYNKLKNVVLNSKETYNTKQVSSKRHSSALKTLKLSWSCAAQSTLHW